MAIQNHFERLTTHAVYTVKCDEEEIVRYWNSGFRLHLMAKSLLRSREVRDLLRAGDLLARVVALMPNYHGALLDFAAFRAISLDGNPANLASLQEACRLYERVIAAFPDDLAARRNLGLLYLDEPRVENRERAHALLSKGSSRGTPGYLSERLVALQRRLSS